MPAYRNSQAWNAREIGVDGVDVAQIHFERVVELASKLEGGCRRGRRKEHIDLLECAVEITPNQRPYTLAFRVILVVVTGRQNVRAQHDTPLHFLAKPLRTRGCIKLLQDRLIIRIQRLEVGAVTIANPIIPSEVA